MSTITDTIISTTLLRKQHLVLERIAKCSKRQAFLKHFETYGNIAFAASLVGLTKQQGNNCIVSLRKVGLNASEPKLRGSNSQDTIVARAISVGQYMLANSQTFLDEHYGSAAPACDSQLGKYLLLDALDTLHEMTMVKPELIDEFVDEAKNFISK